MTSSGPRVRATKPRILCLVQLPPPVHGASLVNQHVVSCDRIRAEFDLEVIPLRFASSVGDISRLSVKKLWKALEIGGQLFASLVRSRPDAAYFTLAPTGGAFYRDCAYVALLKTFGVRRIYHLHGRGIAEQLSLPWRRRLYRWAFDGAAVIQLSPLLAEDTAGLVPTHATFFVANGITTPKREPRAPSGTDTPLRVLYLSTMVEDKGPLILVEALGRLRERGIPFRATFAGAPYSDCVDKFRARVSELGLDGDVSYIGPVFGADKEHAFRSHDVLVLPSVREAFPLVVLEAMAAELPVISTRQGALPEMVLEGETGFLVPVRDPAAVASALEALTAEPLRAAMGARARAHLEEHFTIARFDESLTSAWKRALAPRA